MLRINITFIILLYSIIYFNIIATNKRNINIQYFLLKNRLSHLKYKLMKNINNIMEVELKRYVFLGYNDAINNFDGNNTISGFIKNNLNEDLKNLTTLLFPIDILYKENNDHFKYKITPYIEKIHYLDIPIQYKTSIIKYCHYSNIKMIKSLYKINKIFKYSSEEYIKTNTAKSFIRWKLRKIFL